MHLSFFSIQMNQINGKQDNSTAGLYAPTKDGLRIELLKGTDRAKADALFAAAESAGCVAHLAIITRWLSGSAEGDYDYSSSRYGRSRGYRRSYDEDDDDDHENDNASAYSMGEVYDHSLAVDHWSNQTGKSLLLGEISLDEAEIVSADSIDDWETSKEEFEGYTGNAGMTLERWYHRAAIIIWPFQHHFKILSDAGTDASIAGLSEMVKKLKRTSKSNRDKQYQDCLAFANAIIDTWEPVRDRSWSSSNEGIKSIDRSLFTQVVAELDDVDLIKRFLANALPNDKSLQLNSALIKRCASHQWETFRESLYLVVKSIAVDTLERNLSLIQLFCCDSSVVPDQFAFGNELLIAIVESIIAFDLSDGSSKLRWDESIDRTKVIEKLVEMALAFGNEMSLKCFLEHAIAVPNHYDLTNAHLKAIFSLEKRIQQETGKKTCKALIDWLKTCLSELERRTAIPPQPPSDYQRSANMKCKCADCLRVAVFLKDGDTKQLSLPLAKQRRQHMHIQIESCRLELTHVTERRGSPHVLVLTKTNALFEESRKIYDLNLKNLSRLNAILQKVQ